MEELVKTFHIDGYLILAQLVNFFIVLAILFKFAYKPVLALLNDRAAKIEKSLDDAKRIEDRLVAQEEDYKKVIAEARREAQAILEQANVKAEEKQQAMILKAKEEIGVIINKEKEKMLSEKAETMKELKKEVVELVSLSLEKLIGEKVTSKADQDLIKTLVKEAN
jgi:F-type H+-transporting ATPase subunit b